MTDDPSRAMHDLLAGLGVSERVRQAIAAVRRENFAPDVWWEQNDDELWVPCLRNVDGDDVWRQAVYADGPMVTQVDGGLEPAPGARGERSTCSLSAPRIVADMLDAAGIESGVRVLEIGAGQGWSAALAGYLAGPLGSVVSIEYDPVLADVARANLARVGAGNVEVVTGDGRGGFPAGAPYDVVIATATFDPLPVAWLTQAATGARVVAPMQSAFYPFGLLAGSVGADGALTGRFVDDANFMLDRGASRLPRNPWVLFEHQGDGAESKTALSPAVVRACDAALFAIGRLLPGVYWWVGRYDEPGMAEHYTWWVYDGTSWAAVDFVPGADVFEVEQYGPRRLWDEVEAAHGWWMSAGEPSPDQFGLTVSPDGVHTLWIGEPSNVVSTLPVEA